MKLPLKKTVAALSLVLAMTHAAFGTSAWSADQSYNEGDKIVYQGTYYEAARTSTNTPPQTSDNSWFWVETTAEAAATPTTVVADKFSVDFGRFSNNNQISLSNLGAEFNYFPPVGGSENAKISAYGIDMSEASTTDTTTTNLTSGKIVLNANVIGATGRVNESTVIDASSITTGSIDADKIVMTEQFGGAELSAAGGLQITSSFGNVTVNDHGITTDKNIIVSGVNLLQKLAVLEARIAELEATK